MSESQVSKAQNLARIRDNQRRSRARRKEYLQELEAKLRSCEQLGIEASAEIQSAARRVLEENKKLRALLRERGIPEVEILAVMGSSNEKPFEYASAASSLDNMLERRQACQVPSGCDSNIDSTQRMQCQSTTLASRAPEVPLTVSHHSAPTLNNDTPSPRSIVSSTGTSPGFSSDPFFHLAPTIEAKPEISLPQYAHQYEQPIHNSWNYANEAHYTPEPSIYYNTSSCIDAADIIRTMRSDIGLDLENELGCHSRNENCYVDNSVVFNIMDKYSNHRSGI